MPSPLDARLFWSLVAAVLIGALVGIEREKSKAQAGNVGIGGVRTFVLFALTGALASWLAQSLGSAFVLVATVLAVAALVIAGYVMQARSKPDAIGLTTETAALAVCLLGAVCTAGHPELALAGGIAVSAFLAYKQSLHGLVAKLGADDISAGVKLLAATFIVLPLLPTRAIDPWGALVPRSLWLLVILIAGLSLVGYVATRALGAERGTAITGLTGGLVSSTAVTLTFAKRSREEKGATDDALAAGTFLAWGVSFARVLVLSALIHPPLALLAARPVRCDDARRRRERALAAAPLGSVGRAHRTGRAAQPVQPGGGRQVRAAVRRRAAGDDAGAAALPERRHVRGRGPGRHERRRRDHAVDGDARAPGRRAAQDGGARDPGRGALEHARQVRNQRRARRGAPAPHALLLTAALVAIGLGAFAAL